MILAMDVNQLKNQLASTAFAFRGYNVTNLGRSAEFLEHAQFGPIVQQYLEDASHTCAELTGRPTDLVQRVRQGTETTLETYAEAISLI